MSIQNSISLVDIDKYKKNNESTLNFSIVDIDELFHTMFCEYSRELEILENFDNKQKLSYLKSFDEKNIDSYCPETYTDSLLKKSDMTRYFIKDNKDNIIGFLLIGFDSETPPYSDFFIDDLYIKPEYRQKGYGKECIELFLKDNPCERISLYILKVNNIAKKFWKKVFEDNFFDDVSSTYNIQYIPAGCYFKTYERICGGKH